MKVKLTNRKFVEAESESYKVTVREYETVVKTDFGQVRVVRNRDGLRVILHAQSKIGAEPANEFFSVVMPDGKEQLILDRQNFDVTLRPIGSVRMGELDTTPELKPVVEDWLKRQNKTS